MLQIFSQMVVYKHRFDNSNRTSSKQTFNQNITVGLTELIIVYSVYYFSNCVGAIKENITYIFYVYMTQLKKCVN